MARIGRTGRAAEASSPGTTVTPSYLRTRFRVTAGSALTWTTVCLNRTNHITLHSTWCGRQSVLCAGSTSGFRVNGRPRLVFTRSAHRTSSAVRSVRPPVREEPRYMPFSRGRWNADVEALTVKLCWTEDRHNSSMSK